jgi:hypothetical protein
MNNINFSSTLKVLGSELKLEDVFYSIKGGEHSEQVNAYREALNNNVAAAAELKKQLPCFTVSGLFKESRGLNNLEAYNQIIHLDYDLKDADKAYVVMSAVKEMPHTYCAFTSPSYGVKVFILTNSTAENHNDYFSEIKQFYDNFLGVESDKSVKDITRLCFISDDPDLFLNAKSAKFQLGYTKSTNMDTLWDFTHNVKTYEEGNRNNFILLYSCNASRRGIEESQTYAFLNERCTDLDEMEILSTVSSAYKATILDFNKFGRVTKSSKDSISHLANNTAGFDSVNYDFESEDSPMISDATYSLLPLTLKEACEQFSGREKDVFLTGLITSLSAVMHNVTGVYDGGIVYPNLFSFVTAPAASGKGSIKYSKAILKCYHETVRALSENSPQAFFIPANNSASKIYEMLEANGGIGLIFETEADTLSNSMKQEWGSFSDVLRKAFHNEPISQARRLNDEFFEIDEPKFSICLTGTNEQVGRLISSTEDGLFSRFLFYSFSTEFEWKNTLMDVVPTKQIYFNELNGDICDLLKGSKPRRFNLNDSQIVIFNESFSKLSKRINYSYPEALDQVKRAGLKVYKLAMTLSAFRTIDGDVTCNDDDFEFALNVVTEVYLPHQINVMRKLYSNNQNLSGAHYMLSKLPENFDRGNIDSVYEGANQPPSDKTISNYVNSLIKQGKIARVSQGKYKKRL